MCTNDVWKRTFHFRCNKDSSQNLDESENESDVHRNESHMNHMKESHVERNQLSARITCEINKWIVL